MLAKRLMFFLPVELRPPFSPNSIPDAHLRQMHQLEVDKTCYAFRTRPARNDAASNSVSSDDVWFQQLISVLAACRSPEQLCLAFRMFIQPHRFPVMSLLSLRSSDRNVQIVNNAPSSSQRGHSALNDVLAFLGVDKAVPLNTVSPPSPVFPPP